VGGVSICTADAVPVHVEGGGGAGVAEAMGDRDHNTKSLVAIEVREMALGADAMAEHFGIRILPPTPLG
jgi:hypothetical protein